jgi:hypothetical protein
MVGDNACRPLWRDSNALECLKARQPRESTDQHPGRVGSGFRRCGCLPRAPPTGRNSRCEPNAGFTGVWSTSNAVIFTPLFSYTNPSVISSARMTTPSGATRSSYRRIRMSCSNDIMRFVPLGPLLAPSWPPLGPLLAPSWPPLGPHTPSGRSRPGVSQPVSHRSGKPTTWSECMWVRAECNWNRHQVGASHAA